MGWRTDKAGRHKIRRRAEKLTPERVERDRLGVRWWPRSERQ
ncbi:hypothetical protein [Streptomyces olivaceoviridis]